MQKTEKERVVAELTERLRGTETLIVADYRGLTNKQFEQLRGRLIEHGARLVVVKNTLTRRAAEAAGADALLALLEGPTAIAFIQADGDPAAVAKALADTARESKVLALRGGILQGRALSGADVDELGKLPPVDVLKGQVVGAILAPLNQLAGLLNAPLQNLVGLIDARIEQLGGPGGSADAEAPAEGEPPAAEAAPEEPARESDDSPEASAPADAPGSAEASDDPEAIESTEAVDNADAPDSEEE
jgi:large subunit ribosomal protein L10